MYFTEKLYKMMDNKSKISLMRHTHDITKIYISLMKINNIILMLRTLIILLTSFIE